MNKTLQILSIDAWKDSYNGGWTWNNWLFKVGQFPAELLDSTPRKIFRWMRENGFLSCFSAGKVSLEDDGYNLVIKERSNDCPIFAIEYGSQID